MKRYRVLRNCHGFMRRYWEAGKIVELDDNANPPHHFALIDENAAPVKDPMAPVVVEQNTLASFQSRPALKTGMAAGLEAPKNPIVGRKKPAKK